MHGGSWQCCPLDWAHFELPASVVLPQKPLGRKSRVGWGLLCRSLTKEREGAGVSLAWQSCMCHIKATLRREEALQAFTERAALAHGSLMGHKFLSRIVAC